MSSQHFREWPKVETRPLGKGCQIRGIGPNPRQFRSAPPEARNQGMRPVMCIFKLGRASPMMGPTILSSGCPYDAQRCLPWPDVRVRHPMQKTHIWTPAHAMG